MDSVKVDCDTCVVRGLACGDCVVSVLLGMPTSTTEELVFDENERAALAALADCGLVPPLRLIPGTVAARSVPPPLPWQDYA